MIKHVNVGRAFAVAAALTLGTSSIVAAQSTTRIPVSKEPPRTETTSPGTVEVVRVDTVTVYRRDTVQVAGPTQYRTDTLWRTPAPVMRNVGGLYFSLGGGASAPNQQMERGYETGWHALAALGWQPVNSPLGVQVDASYNRFDRVGGFNFGPGFAGEAAEPTMWTASGVGRLAVPVFRALSSRGVQLYGLGGITYHVFKGFDPAGSGLNTEPPQAGGEGNDPDEWNDDFGFVAGGGISLRLSRAELFVEGRRNWISAANYQTGYVPVTIGLTWR